MEEPNLESNKTLKNEQSVEECEESLKGPSFTLMYVLLIALLSFILISIYSLNQLAHIEKERSNQVSEIKSALANLETLPDKLYTAEGEKKNLSVTIEYPKIFVDQEDYLGTIIPIIQEQNAQAYDKLSSNITLFSVIIALFTLALPVFSYAFIQKDQLRNINAQHYRLKKDALQRFDVLESKNDNLKNTLMQTVNEEIEKLRKEINQAQEVTSSVIPNPKGNDAVEIKPTDETPAAAARAFFLGAKINLSKKNYDEALKQIDQAINLEPNNASYYSIRGVILHQLNRYKEAIYDENKAIDLEPNNARYYDNRGATLHEMEQYEDAVKDSNKAIDLEQNNADYYDNRAVTLHNLKRYEDALKDSNKAIDLKPNKAGYYDNRGAILRGLKRYKEAQIDLENALLLEPTGKEYHTDLIYTLYKRGLYNQALKRCAELGDDIASSILALRTRAMSTLKLALQQGRKISREERELIMNDLNKAVEINLENRFSLLDQAQAFFLLGEFDSMRESLEKAVVIDSKEPETYHWLAEYYRAIGDVENATLNDRLADEKGYIPEPEQ